MTSPVSAVCSERQEQDGVRRVQPREGGRRAQQEDRQRARAGRREGQQGGQAAAARRRREREVDDREADENNPRDWLQLGGVSPVPTRGLQQHHSESDGNH